MIGDQDQSVSEASQVRIAALMIEELALFDTIVKKQLLPSSEIINSGTFLYLVC